MKLEEEMYVRTKEGIIAKCTEIRINRYMFDKIILENGYYNDWEFIDIPKEKSLIKKASNNIIDLIEVGDYVNGYKVENLLSFDNERKLGFVNGLRLNGDNRHPIWLSNMKQEEIKSILTHEMYEANCYKVVE